jgi:hypothetical protein
MNKSNIPKKFKTLKNVYASLLEADLNKVQALRSFSNRYKIKKINSNDIEISGTCLKGYVKTTHKQLIDKFGKPIYTEDDKVLARWVIQFEDGLIVTIYVYREKRIPREEYNWHVGGPCNIDDEEVVSRIENILGSPSLTRAEYYEQNW